MDVLPMNNTLDAIIGQLRDTATAHRTAADHIDQAVEHLLDMPTETTGIEPESSQPEPEPAELVGTVDEPAEVRSYRCEPCGEAFKSPQALGSHNRYNHSPATPATEKPATADGRYGCELCGMEYLTGPARDRHQSRCRL